MTLDVRRVEALVIGGSAGSFGVLKVLLPGLPGSLAIPVLVVVHLPPDRPSAIAEVFGREASMRTKEAEDKEPLGPGVVYFAPPGYHLLVERDRSLALAMDDAVHHSRPSIDVLFESAADVFGDRLIAVLLSGANADGAAGMDAVHTAGGITIVQDPASAEYPAMPQAALDLGTPSYVLPVADIQEILERLPVRDHDSHEAVDHV
jgi:two-component system chemotaxis response regulator CheB